MNTNTVGLFLRHLALSDEVSRLAAASDRDLLADYESERGEAAFTELVRRHGPMVLRTCRRILGRGPDAEDAFQATFVLLARKAGPLRRETAGRLSLGGWLHRVAYQTALDVLAKSTRRKARERQGAMTPPDPDPVTEATWNEVRPILDAELNALPDEARRLLIACYLQGKTHAEAAAALGLPLGSVACRLEKARALLGQRLLRRGISLSAALLAVLLGDLARGAGVPAVLMVHTVMAATTFTTQATGAVSTSVARLVEGGLASMAKSSTRFGLACYLGLALLGAGLLACWASGAWLDKTPEAAPGARAPERPGQEENKPALTDRLGDPLPPGALARLGTVRLRIAANGPRSILFTHDGREVITAGRNNPTRLWETSSGKLIRQFGDSSPQQVDRIALSPDGRILASGGAGNRLHLWETATGKLLAKGETEAGDCACLALSPDGKLVAAASHDNKLHVWNAATGEEQWVQTNAAGHVFALAFSLDSKTVAAVDAQAVSLWDAATGKREPRQWKPNRPLSSAVFTPDGRLLAVVCNPLPRATERDSVVCLVDVSTLKEVRQLAPRNGEQGGVDAFQALAVSGDGKVLATANGVGEVRLWDVATGKELRRCQGGRNFVNALAFSADGSRLAGVDRGLVRSWETASGKEISSVQGGHTHQVTAVAFLPDGETLLSSSWDGSVRVWDSATGEERQHLSATGDDLADYELAGIASTVAPDGKTLTMVDLAWPLKQEPFGVVIRMWDREAGRERSRCFQELGHQLPGPVVLSPDGKMVACMPGTGTTEEVHLWEAATGKLLSKIAGTNPAFASDSKLLATIHGRRNGQVVSLWEAATARELCSVAVPQGYTCYRLGFSPERNTLVTLSNAGTKSTIHLWPLTPTPLPTLGERGRGEGPDESRKSGSGLRVGLPRVLAEGLPSVFIETFAFSPDGRTLALPDDKGTVRLLETATGKERARFSGHVGSVHSLSFSPDGRRLASGSRDTTILIWDVTGRLHNGRLRPAQVSAKEREELWTDLAADDASRAERALWTLAADSEETLPFLTKRLRPAVPVAPEVMGKLLRDLDDDAFAVRTRAREELEKLGPSAEPALRQALEKNPSVEVRKRIEELLDVMEAQRKCPSGDVLRGLRAVELLEQIGGRDAQALLKELAAGAPDCSLTREAQTTLRRLERR